MAQPLLPAGDDAAAGFSVLVAGLQAQRDEVGGLRPELDFEDVPAPRTLAPYASAIAATVWVGDDEIASGRLILLYDPAGQTGWAGPLRVIAYIRADLDPDIAEDPLIGQVGWTWLTEALGNHTAGYAEPSGTVTTVITEGFGAKESEAAVTGFELRASWSPAGSGALPVPDTRPAPGPGPEIMDGHLAAWCDALCAAAGLPPLAEGVTALPPSSRRPR
ncbi:MAG: hypothetical protein JWL68_3145 [Actinomycetia bacterium]|nr:hypothetical protein [Actinomycetes bacterium]MDX6332683.1 hypothetical protein [Streptosporangiaceae bacterium]